MCKGSIPQTFVQRMDLPPLSVSKPDLNFDFPTNSQNSKKPRNRMAPGLFRSLSRTKHPSQDQHRIAKGKEAILFLHSYAVSFHGLFVAIESGHQHDQSAFRQVEVGRSGHRCTAAIRRDTGRPRCFRCRDGFSPYLAATASRVRQLVVPTANHPAARCLGSLDLMGGLLVDAIPLAVHLMVGQSHPPARGGKFQGPHAGSLQQTPRPWHAMPPSAAG